MFIRQHKQAWASLKKQPRFVFTVLLTMSVTLGALLCAITLNYLLLVKPLPYPEQDRLFVAEHRVLGVEKQFMGPFASYPGLVQLYENKEVFEKASMIIYGRDVIVSHDDQPLVNTAHVTSELHHILESPLVLGRMFEASEAINAHNPVAMLSYSTWQKEFGGRSDILDQKITLSGVSYRIIGVLAKRFVEPKLAGSGQEVQVWLPWDYNQTSKFDRQDYGTVDGNYKFIGLLKNNINSNQAEQILTPIMNESWQEGVASIDFFKDWSVLISMVPLKEAMIGQSALTAVIFLAGMVGLALIACVNISNLFMARIAQKQRQMAIQAAIGATKKHVFKAIFAETSLLMCISTVLALILANVGFFIMQKYYVAVLPRVDELDFNFINLGCLVIVSLFIALVFAKLSSNMLNYRALNTSLQSSGKGSALQVSKKTRQLLITSQIALATVLIFVNFSLLNSALKTINTPLGFTTSNISVLTLNYSSVDTASEEEVISKMTEIVDKIETLPEVDSISQSYSPIAGFWGRKFINISSNEQYIPYYDEIDHRYFNILNQQLVRGDNFTRSDFRDSNNVMIVNQAFAQELTTDGNALGLKLSNEEYDSTFEIIGIVNGINLKDINALGRDDITGTAVPRAYIPGGLYKQSFMLKFKPGQSVSRQQLAELLAEVDSRYSVFNFKTLSDIVNQFYITEITVSVTTSVLASFIFLLAAIGLYGILSYGTQLRQYELGTRMAIGATRKNLIFMIIGDNTKPVLIGFVGSIVLFAITYIGLSEYIQLLLTWHVLPMVLVTLVLVILMVLFACYWPLRQYFNKAVVYSLRGSD
jgi:predicted permease